MGSGAFRQAARRRCLPLCLSMPGRRGWLLTRMVCCKHEGTHADKIETSMMLYIAPNSVDMAKATKDCPTGTGPLTPEKGNAGKYPPSGIYGDATLARQRRESLKRRLPTFSAISRHFAASRCLSDIGRIDSDECRRLSRQEQAHSRWSRVRRRGTMRAAAQRMDQ